MRVEHGVLAARRLEGLLPNTVSVLELKGNKEAAPARHYIILGGVKEGGSQMAH